MDSLGFVAQEAGERTKWRQFAVFAEQRAKGLRAPAFAALNAFVREAGEWPFEERLAISRWLLERSSGFSDRTVLLPQPLVAGLVVDTLREWAEREPESAEPRLWLGLLRCDDSSEHLERALALDPSCAQARWMLVSWALADVEYNQHHLPAFYIHDPRDDLKALDRVEQLIEGDPDHEQAKAFREEVADLRTGAEAWLALHPAERDFAAY